MYSVSSKLLLLTLTGLKWVIGSCHDIWAFWMIVLDCQSRKCGFLPQNIPKFHLQLQTYPNISYKAFLKIDGRRRTKEDKWNYI